MDRVGKRRVCALTCARAYHGCRKPAGECRMTRLAYGDATLDDGLGQSKYTVCGNCRHALCVNCLEQVALVVDAHSQRVVAHDVFHALMVRAWRQTAGRCRGFELRHGGGGTWTTYCPLCINIKFIKPIIPVPRTLCGRDYDLSLIHI